MIAPFSISRLPRILFGSGQFQALPELLRQYGQRVLLVTGARSFRQTPRWPWLTGQLIERDMHLFDLQISGEPSPQRVDQAVSEFRLAAIDVVVAIGGGSVLDAAKAIAGLLPHGNSVMDHLEGVGRNIPYTGPATPFIAVPTTAGTGSEATKNAVLSVQGENGFKKSFRHDDLVPQYALVDPDLLASCPPELIAADGMDAFTQLLESYVSARANPITDALAFSGMHYFRDGFFAALRGGETNQAQAGRAAIAYASLLSGITLAQAGLGSVHGLAAPLGAFFPIPHGLACGTLLAEATAVNIQALQLRSPADPALDKYASIGRLLGEDSHLSQHEAFTTLLEKLRMWTQFLRLPGLGKYGVEPRHIENIVANARGSSMQTNPIVLTDMEIAEIVQRRF